MKFSPRLAVTAVLPYFTAFPGKIPIQMQYLKFLVLVWVVPCNPIHICQQYAKLPQSPQFHRGIEIIVVVEFFSFICLLPSQHQ